MALNPVRILGDIIVGIVKLLLAWGRMERMMMPIVGLGYLLGFREDEEDDGADNENENELVDHSESESGQDGVLKLVIGISAGLIVLLSLAIAGLWIISEAANSTIGGPPSALLTWEDEYRDMTGVDAVS